MSKSLENLGRFIRSKGERIQMEGNKETDPDRELVKEILAELEQDISDIRKFLNLGEPTMWVMFKDNQGDDCYYGGNSFEELVQCMKANSAMPIRTFAVYEKQDFGSKVLGYITNSTDSNYRYNYVWTDFRVSFF